jgi:hypothetical protein
MINPFSFQPPIGRLSYLLWIVPVFLSQHVFVWLVATWQGLPLSFNDFQFYVYPLRSLIADATHVVVFDNMPRTTVIVLPNWLLFVGFVFVLLQIWATVALSYRRAVDARMDAWLAAAAIAPLIQFAAIIALCTITHGDRSEEGPAIAIERQRVSSGWRGGLKGLLAGMALTLAGVAVSALIFGTYGYGVFLISPFLMGVLTGYFANESNEMSRGETAQIVMATSFLGGTALVLTALEGVGCIFMAAPLGIALAVGGGMLGRDAALAGRTSGGKMASSVAILPIVFAIEAVFPPSARFETVQSIEVAAPPDRVWAAIVRMETITEPISLIHHVGIAYPVRGRVFGEGVGALRYGDFSTGTAVERVTEWEVNRKLAFVVLKDIPGLRELSPYRHVHAPHVHGYFTTRETSFELIPRAGGITEIVERTSHQLKLDPALYWLPFARHMVDTNNARVLRHIKAQAERSLVAASSPSP